MQTLVKVKRPRAPRQDFKREVDLLGPAEPLHVIGLEALLHLDARPTRTPWPSLRLDQLTHGPAAALQPLVTHPLTVTEAVDVVFAGVGLLHLRRRLGSLDHLLLRLFRDRTFSP